MPGELDEGVEFGEGVAAIEGGLGFFERGLEITRPGGEGSGGIEKDGVAARAVQFIAEEVAHHLCGFVGRATTEVSDGGRRETEFDRIEVIRFDSVVFEMADAIDARRVEFVETVRAVNDERGFGTEFVEDVRKRLGEFGVENARELNVRARRIGERSKNVEDGALTDFLARTDGVLHGRMKLGCKHKSDADLLNGLRNLFSGEVEIHAESGEDVGASALR